jgi:hypothetical protein
MCSLFVCVAEVDQSQFRVSESVEGSMLKGFCHIRLPGSIKGIHVIQFLSPLTEDRNYFCCRIRKLSEYSDRNANVRWTPENCCMLEGIKRPHSKTS